MAVFRINLESRLPDGSTQIRAVCVRLRGSEMLRTAATPSSLARPASEPQSSCAVCSAIMEAFAAADRDDKFFANFLDRDDVMNCNEHTNFFESVMASSTPPQRAECGQAVYLIKHKQSLLRLSPLEDSMATGQKNDRKDIVVMVETEYSGRTVGIGRAVNANWINLDTIRQWRDVCERDHGQDCSGTNFQLHSIPLPWLVDTFRQCLVRSNPGVRYVALSYVWGEVGKTATAKKENIEQLQKRNSLGDGGPLKLPRTLRDSMQLCRELGERYLWVDTLCIVQDDPETRGHMIANMTSIYAGAIFTIFAADGEHADYGLRGLPGSIPRNFVTPFKGPFGKLFFMHPSTSFSKTKWNTRGWTFQEYLFSPRRLVFVADTVRWECCQICCWEEIAQPGNPISGKKGNRLTDDDPSVYYDRDFTPIRTTSIPSLKSFPDLTNLQSLISSYNQRNISFDGDAIPAFAGMLMAVNNTFSHGFAWGLPIMFFDIALLWRGNTGVFNQPLRQRTPTKSDDIIPPSWTWAAWHGQLSDRAWENSEYLCGQDTPKYWTVPIVDWCTRTDKDADPMPIPHVNEWHAYRKHYMGRSTDLPPGWTYTLTKESSSTPETAMHDPDRGTSVKGVYNHENLNGNAFWYPIPLAKVQSPTITSPSDQPLQYGRYLSCRSQQACLTICKRTGIMPAYDTNFKVPLASPDNMDQVICRLAADLGFPLGEIGDTVKVVAVSGRYPPRCPVQEAEDNIESYNVLCVEWKDGVAYRRGVGEVKADAWERLGKEEVDLILG